MPRKRFWVQYIERRYHTVLDAARGEANLQRLIATQAEIELVKYHMVRDEAFRMDEPVLVYHAGGGHFYLLDGHTRARVVWDRGGRTVPADIYSSASPAIDEELVRMALAAGGGTNRHIWQVPILDRLGEGSDAWRKRREELLADYRRDVNS